MQQHSGAPCCRGHPRETRTPHRRVLSRHKFPHVQLVHFLERAPRNVVARLQRGAGKELRERVSVAVADWECVPWLRGHSPPPLTLLPPRQLLLYRSRCEILTASSAQSPLDPCPELRVSHPSHHPAPRCAPSAPAAASACMCVCKGVKTHRTGSRSCTSVQALTDSMHSLSHTHTHSLCSCYRTFDALYAHYPYGQDLQVPFFEKKSSKDIASAFISGQEGANSRQRFPWSLPRFLLRNDMVAKAMVQACS